MAKPNLPLQSYFGPYFLVKLIAVGGMAEIYLARARGVAGFEKQLALKVLHPDYAAEKAFTQMLVNEAKIAVGLNHPNIAQTFDLGKINNRYFISMEYIDGADFFQILTRLSDGGSAVPVEAALRVAQQVLAGLEYAHGRCDDAGKPLQIIHRDISPQNILISREGAVKIVDFGIAKAANLTNKTRAGVIKGKLIYMSPEQAWGDPVDQRADLFSTGIVLFEALTAGSLYLEKNPVRLLELVRKAEIKPPSSRRPEIPPELDALVMRALMPRPADRYQTAREFAASIGDYLRRTAPAYTEEELGKLVEAVLASGKRRTLPHGAERERMQRGDFAIQNHSLIFAAEDMAGSSPALAAGQHEPGSTGPAPVPPTPPPTSPPAAAAGGAARAASTPRAKLLLLENGEAKPFVMGEQFAIGRAGDLRLGDARVSRRHARIVLHGGAYVLEDLGSANGTFLNDERIDRPTALASGDMLRVGPYEMRFVVDGGGSATPLPTPAQAQAYAQAPAPAELERFEPDPTPAAEEARAAALAEEQPRLSPSAAAAAAAGHVAAADLTAPRSEDRSTDGASLRLAVGGEQLMLLIGDRLPLSHAVLVGGTELVGEAAALVKRPDGYWIEPTEGVEGVIHNGRPIAAPRQLENGDTLQVGPLRMEFVS